MKTAIRKLIVMCLLGSAVVNAAAEEKAVPAPTQHSTTSDSLTSHSATNELSGTLAEEKRGALIGGLVGAGLGGPFGAGVGVIVGGGWLGKLIGLHRVNDELNTEIKGLAQAHANDETRYNRQVARLTRALAKAEAQQAVVEAVPIQFRTASAALETHYRKELAELASTLAKRGDARVLLSGFADRRGDAAYNLKLSEDRVAEVRRFLLSRGVSTAQIETRAFGESMPVSDAESPEDYFFDRRVVMELISSDSSKNRVNNQLDNNSTNSKGLAVR